MLLQKLSDDFKPDFQISLELLKAGIKYKEGMHWYMGTYLTAPYPDKTKYIKTYLLTKELLSDSNLKKLTKQFNEVKKGNALFSSIHDMLKSVTTEYQLLTVIMVTEPFMDATGTIPLKMNRSIEWVHEETQG